MATTLEFSTVPYPGLRPFRYDESDIFFGRETQTDQLLARLARNHFLAVTGPSGCGKSSLVKAGMIPALSAGFMVEGGSHWRIRELRPGDRPLGRLARAMASSEILGAERTDHDSVALVDATIRRGPLGLVEIVQTAETLKGAALLVVIDQFEEIFRYHERIAVDEADAFVALLLASARQNEVPIYVVITMRSDYIGDCARFHGLAEAVSEAQYLTPRLTREDLELVIAGPARVFGGQVEPKLLNRLINDFGTDPDQLPLLQHALSRLWSRCTTSSTPRLLTIEDYQSIGGLSDALSNHCDEVFDELTPEQQRIAEVLFRRLSGTQDDRQDVRAPARVSEIARIAAVDCNEVIAVADAFRRADRCFLATPEGPLNEDTLLDLSHESLIRQWRTLFGWVTEEAKSIEMYLRLRDWALRWEQRDAELWHGLDLMNAIAWRQREALSEAWAERYGDRTEFHLVMKFLNASVEAFDASVETVAEAARQEQLDLRFSALPADRVTGGTFEPVLGFWDGIRARHQSLPTVTTIPGDRCRPANTAGYHISTNQMYFTILIREMHLAQNQQWWAAFEPLVIVIAEFNHGQERVVVPNVIGPNLIQKQASSDRPNVGVVLVDTRVTGPHPYRGGDVSISVGFYKVRRSSDAHILLKVLDSFSAALRAPGDLWAIAKTGGALLEGIEGLLGFEDTMYLAADHISMVGSPFDSLKAGYSALIAAPTPDDLTRLCVENSRLYVETDGGRCPYRDSDFVLLNVTGTEARGDENLLPFYPLKVNAMTALRDGEDGVKRGKAYLIAAYDQMRRSPDVTANQANRLFDAWLQEFETERKYAERARSM
jgi:hypothetical protein